jgi:hypothetical protein
VSQTVMDRSQTDPKLGEVRAVLQRLQTFSAEPNNSSLPTELPSDLPNEAGSHDGGPSQPTARRRAPAAIGLAIAGTAVVALGLVWLTVSSADRAYLPGAATPNATSGNNAISERSVVSERAASAGQPALRPSAVSRAEIDVAQDLLAKGQVQAARKQLLGLVSGGTADVAWMMARSYDPNFLATLPRPDATPDIEQAAHWYRTWHAAAVVQGLVPNSVSVERIIGSMR